MTALQWIDVLRAFTAAMLLFVLYDQVVRKRKLRDRYTNSFRDFWWVFTISMFILFHFSLEPLIFDKQGDSSHAILIFFVACVAFRASLRKPARAFEHRDDPSHRVI